MAVAKGRYKALLDANLYLPEDWDADRDRCRAAGVPDHVRYRPKWRIALEQLARLEATGVAFDWLTFDEGYGAQVPLLRVLNLAGRRFVAEVPRSFAVRASADVPARRADERLPAHRTGTWQRFRLARQTQADQVWARRCGVWAAGQSHRLVTPSTRRREVKHFLTNARTARLGRSCGWRSSVERGACVSGGQVRPGSCTTGRTSQNDAAPGARAGVQSFVAVLEQLRENPLLTLEQCAAEPAVPALFRRHGVGDPR